MWGLGGDDTLEGGTGNDWLFAGEGHDTYRGGPGRDHFEDEAGGDLYQYDRGDGVDFYIDRSNPADTDILRFGTGIAPADVQVRRLEDGTSLYLEILEGGVSRGDELWWTGAFDSDQRGRLERIEFAGGPVWTHEDIQRFLDHGLPLPLASGLGNALEADAGHDLAWADAMAAFAADADADAGALAAPAPPRGQAGWTWAEELNASQRLL